MTTTSTVPAFPLGLVAVNCVLLAKVTELVATPPKVTVAPLWKLEPLIVVTVPPVVGPVLGLTEDIVGAVAGGLGELGARVGPPGLPQAFRRSIATKIKVPIVFPPKEASVCRDPGNIIESSHLSPPVIC